MPSPKKLGWGLNGSKKTKYNLKSRERKPTPPLLKDKKAKKS
jgi:hypothetical protein